MLWQYVVGGRCMYVSDVFMECGGGRFVGSYHALCGNVAKMIVGGDLAKNPPVDLANNLATSGSGREPP